MRSIELLISEAVGSKAVVFTGACGSSHNRFFPMLKGLWR